MIKILKGADPRVNVLIIVYVIATIG